MFKFITGQKVQVIGNYTGHNIKLGTTVLIIQGYSEDRSPYYEVQRPDGLQTYAYERDLGLKCPRLNV